MNTFRTLTCWLMLASVIPLLACGDDSSDDDLVLDAGPVSGDAADAATPPDTAIPAAVSDTDDASEPRGSEPESVAPQDDDAGVDEEPASAEEEPEPALPSDGEALSVCASDDDCTGSESLACLLFGTYQGYCTEDCDDDDDCPEIEGLAGICTTDGRCAVDCEVDGEADGECPSNMECIEVTSVLLTSAFTCQYPEPKDGDEYALCNGLRGDADCKEGLSCDAFLGLPLLSELAQPYCAAECSEAGDCVDPGTGATPVCDVNNILEAGGLCALECEDDGHCPGDMECITIDLLQRRCGHRL